jgi:hypothetical protein
MHHLAVFFWHAEDQHDHSQREPDADLLHEVDFAISRLNEFDVLLRQLREF